MPYNGEFHFTALRTLGTSRTMSASSRRPTSRFQPGIPAMYACTGASPSAFAMRGLPPVRSFNGLASLAPGLALVPAFGADSDVVADLRGFVIQSPELNILKRRRNGYAGLQRAAVRTAFSGTDVCPAGESSTIPCPSALPVR